jgi:hypothetical protein
VSIDHPIVLSAAATDLLWDRRRLGQPPALFELPSVGATLAERARLRAAVHRDLTGSTSADVIEALTTVARFDRAIEGVVISGTGSLAFRAATNGRTAVVAVRRNRTIRLAPCRPGLLPAVLPLIGDERPGPGRSVSYPDPDPDEPRGVLRSTRSADNYAAQRRSAQDVLGRPRTRSGWFTVLGRSPAAHLSWFDTTDGRYLAHRRPGPDGRPWSTCAPADTSRIGRHLADLMTATGI